MDDEMIGNGRSDDGACAPSAAKRQAPQGVRTLPAVHVLGVGLADADVRRDDVRLEELAYEVSRSALADAGIPREQLDSVVLGASDELDGRPISSMLMTAPAGGYLTDEIRVTGSGSAALALAVARQLSGDFNLSLVVSWCKPSKTEVSTVANTRWEPFYHRDLGLDNDTTEGLFAQSVSARYNIPLSEVTDRAASAQIRAARNPRGLSRLPQTAEAVAASDYVSTPVRRGHCAPHTDGAACLILASPRWMASHSGHAAYAQISGIGWSTDSYRLDAARLSGVQSARSAWAAALAMAGDGRHIDAVELETPTSFHEAALARALPFGDAQISPSGGTFAQNPLVAAGLVNVVESVLQVSGRAGPVQVPRVRRAVAHSTYGFGHQASVVTVVDSVKEGPHA
ncbi:thiolase C-terminal domain-containing protein [Mycolicibacterium peregrinum]|uniref:thiolase C-terminal domain-containing protein n=1 Tax=Mycolicibacterium peregrinum TaxID=43304 RepID=UPI003AAE8945